MHTTSRLTQWLNTLLSARDVLGSFSRPVEYDTVSLTVCHRLDVSSELRCSDAKQQKWAPPLVTRFAVSIMKTFLILNAKHYFAMITSNL